MQLHDPCGFPSGTVDRLVIRAEKTYTELQRSKTSYPVDYILSKMRNSTIAKVPCPRFKEWTYDLLGLEFTLPITFSALPANIAFGPFNYEREPIQMVRCFPADLLNYKYNVTETPGDFYQPATNWWLLITTRIRPSRPLDLEHLPGEFTDYGIP